MNRPTWGVGWIGPFEGPFTLAWKYSWANLPTAAQIAGLFGRKSLANTNVGGNRSTLLRPPTPNIDGFQTPMWAGRFLSDACGDLWARHLATEDRFRYCPACLVHGYQSSIYQIEALRTCPLHRVPLQDCCRLCGATTAYSLNAWAFRKPFHCWRCSSCWADRFSPEQWSRTEEFHTQCRRSLVEIFTWLTLLRDKNGDQCLITPSAQASWILSQLNIKPPVIAFWAATQLVPLHVDAELFQPFDSRVRFLRVPELGSLVGRRDGNWHANFMATYKSIRRNLQRRYLRRQRPWVNAANLLPVVSGLSRPVQFDQPALAQAFALWRSHFEYAAWRSRSDDPAALRRHRLEFGYRWTGYSDPSSIAFFANEFRDTLLRWNPSDLRSLAELVISHFFGICDAVDRFLRRAQQFAEDHHPTAHAGAALAMAQHQSRVAVADIYVRCVTQFLPFAKVLEAPTFCSANLEPSRRGILIKQLSFSSSAAESLVARDASSNAWVPPSGSSL